MAKLKRRGRTVTFSVSVSPETRQRLQEAAARVYGGNVSALIEAIAVEAERRDALEWLLRRAAPIDDERFAMFLEEMAGKTRNRSRKTG